MSWKIYQNELDLATGFTGDQIHGWGISGIIRWSISPNITWTSIPRTWPSLNAVPPNSRRKSPNPCQRSPPQKKPRPPHAARARTVKSLARLRDQLAALTSDAFAALTERERSLHRRAFTTNTGDPQQREMASFTYLDGETERKVHVPAGDVLHQFRQDVDNGKLPAISWLVAAENFSDHPSAPWYGAWYVSEVLDILTKNPEVWKKTIFILTYDENDGYFDHVPPFVPPHPGEPGTGATSGSLDTALEFDERGHPIGLGYRVPMVIASPWSRGGNVCSQVFDHTSVLRFLEVFLAGKTANPVREENISAWRRTICGDLTSAFRPHDGAKDNHPLPVARDPFVEEIHRAKFKNPPTGFRSLNEDEIADIAKNTQGSPFLPQQEPGTRPSRALPYELHAEGEFDRAAGTFAISFEAGTARFGAKSAGAPFQVYAPDGYRPDDADSYTDAEFRYEHARRWSYAVCAGDKLRYEWPLASFEDSIYHLRTYGPNGFHREYRGNTCDPTLEISCSYADHKDCQIRFTVTNHDTEAVRLTFTDMAYGTAPVIKTLAAGQSIEVCFDLSASFRWYDFMLGADGSPVFSRRFAGRVETGEDSQSDPAIGRRAELVARQEKSTNPAERRN